MFLVVSGSFDSDAIFMIIYFLLINVVAGRE